MCCQPKSLVLDKALHIVLVHHPVEICMADHQALEQSMDASQTAEHSGWPACWFLGPFQRSEVSWYYLHLTNNSTCTEAGCLVVMIIGTSVRSCASHQSFLQLKEVSAVRIFSSKKHSRPDASCSRDKSKRLHLASLFTILGCVSSCCTMNM